MKKLLFCLLLLAAPLATPAQAREFNQAELDALLAPVALYPDALLNQILEASTYPGQVAQAARWSRSNGELAGDAAVNAAQTWGWHPAVTALTAFPDVLQRLDENPQWLRDLGEAYRESEPYVMETVQQLRRRAEAAGNLQSDGQREVSRQGDTILVQPVYPEYVVAPYYNPLIVFGTWWWTSYRPIVWRPWVARPVAWHWHPRPIDRPTHVHNGPAWRPPLPHSQGPRWTGAQRWSGGQRWPNGAPSPAAQMQAAQASAYLDRQRALAAPSPAARFQLAQSQAAVRTMPQVVARPQVQVAASTQVHAIAHAAAVHAAAPRSAPSGGRSQSHR